MKLNNDYRAKKIKLAKKYVDQFNEATLKDIGYKNIEKGKEILKKRKDNYIYDMEL